MPRSIRHCGTDGFFSDICDSEITPLPETCETAADDDCDGLINEEGDSCPAGVAGDADETDSIG